MKQLSECRILIVDDAKPNIDILVAALKNDHKLSVALNGEMALQIAERTPPDLVLLDIMMPGLDGYEVCRRFRKMPTMAYSPVDHARLPKRSPLDDIAGARGVSVVQLALAWVLRDHRVFAIPKAGRVEHVRANHLASQLQLDAGELAAIDAYFKPPRGKRPLEML